MVFWSNPHFCCADFVVLCECSRCPLCGDCFFCPSTMLPLASAKCAFPHRAATQPEPAGRLQRWWTIGISAAHAAAIVPGEVRGHRPRAGASRGRRAWGGKGSCAPPSDSRSGERDCSCRWGVGAGRRRPRQARTARGRSVEDESFHAFGTTARARGNGTRAEAPARTARAQMARSTGALLTLMPLPGPPRASPPSAAQMAG